MLRARDGAGEQRRLLEAQKVESRAVKRRELSRVLWVLRSQALLKGKFREHSQAFETRGE